VSYIVELIVVLLFVEYKTTFGDCWPLLQKVKNIIRINCDETVKLLHVDEKLIESMISKGCFKREQLESITGSPVGMRSMKLLDKIRRSNMKNFYYFVRCLFDVKPRIVSLLNGEAGKENLIVNYEMLTPD
jgi:hypothetical protein